MTNITKMRQEVLEDLYSQAMENREIVRDICAKFVANMAPEEVRQAHHDAGLGDPEERTFHVKLKEEVWHTVKVRAETKDDAIEQAQIALDHGAADESSSEGVAEIFVTGVPD